MSISTMKTSPDVQLHYGVPFYINSTMNKSASTKAVHSMLTDLSHLTVICKSAIDIISLVINVVSCIGKIRQSLGLLCLLHHYFLITLHEFDFFGAAV